MFAGLRIGCVALPVAAAFAASAAAQGPGGAWTQWQQWGGQPGEDYGNLIVAAGDVDGDGVGDILVGSEYADSNGLSRSGFAALHSGRTGAVLFRWPGQVNDAHLGSAVAGISDLDRDGVRDLLVGSSWSDSSGIDNAGAVTVYSGRTGLEARTLFGEARFDYFGTDVASLGDVNGDAYEEFIVLAPYRGQGVVYVFDGASGNLLREDVPASGQEYDGSLEVMGDQDGDGWNDYAIGFAMGSPAGMTEAGIVQLVSGATGARFRTINGPAAYARIGRPLANAGDVDGDGKDDLLAGSPGYYSSYPGSAYLLSGASGALLMTWTNTGANGNLGAAVASAGDADGDGIRDVLLGAPNADHGSQLSAGAAHLHSAATGALIRSYDGLDWYSYFGRSVAGLGDLTGDGLDDFAIGNTANVAGADGGYCVYGFNPFLTPTRDSISVSAGTDLRLRMRFPQDTGFAFWQVLASRAGRGSTLAFGLEIPLATDGVLLRTLAGNYPPFLYGGTGLLTAFGEGEAAIRLRANQLPVSVIGSSIHFAAVARGMNGTGIYASAARAVSFEP